MSVGYFHNKYKYICLLAIVLLAVGSSSASAQSECENLPDSFGQAPVELFEICGKTDNKEAENTTDSISPIAFGSESVADALDSFFLDTPEILTEVGPLVSPTNDFIGGCEFDNTGDFNTIYCISHIGEFFTSNTSDASRTDIGTATPFNGELFTALAMDPTSGVMYACSGNLNTDTSSIFTIDLETGSSNRIGTLTNSPGGIVACAFDNFGQMYGLDLTDEAILKIDKNTGAGTILGPIGFNANFGQGMDFNEVDNTCYLFAFNNDTFRAELRTCDTNDGSTSLVGDLGSTTPGGLTQISGAGIAETFTVSTIFPGYQSNRNMVTANTATPEGRVAFIWGFIPGSTTIGGPTCKGSTIGIKDPRLFGIMKADLDEMAKLVFYIPLNPIFQRPVLNQAVDIDTCRVSNINTNIILNN